MLLVSTGGQVLALLLCNVPMLPHVKQDCCNFWGMRDLTQPRRCAALPVVCVALSEMDDEQAKKKRASGV